MESIIFVALGELGFNKYKYYSSVNKGNYVRTNAAKANKIANNSIIFR